MPRKSPKADFLVLDGSCLILSGYSFPFFFPLPLLNSVARGYLSGKEELKCLSTLPWLLAPHLRGSGSEKQVFCDRDWTVCTTAWRITSLPKGHLRVALFGGFWVPLAEAENTTEQVSVRFPRCGERAHQLSRGGDFPHLRPSLPKPLFKRGSSLDHKMSSGS